MTQTKTPGISPEWMLTVRVYGSIMYDTKKWGEAGQTPMPLQPARIEAWLEDCAKHGVTTILWRANCAGTLSYPSRFTALCGEPSLSRPADSVIAGVAPTRQSWPAEDWDWLGEQCRRFNTLEAAVRASHRHGLKLFLDFNTFDMVGSCCTPALWPAGGERAWNPDWWLWSKDQTRRLAGIPCYAEPVVRRRRVAEIVEALEMGVDGVALGFFSHCDGLCGDQFCEFGFNPVVVEEYRRRYNVNPLTREVDPHLFYALHGEHYTQFVREASQALRQRGKKFLATTRVDGVHGWGGNAAASMINGTMGSQDLRDGHSALPLAAAFYLEWEKWIQEDLVDVLLVAAPARGGIDGLQKMKQYRIPIYLSRKYTAVQGKIIGPLSLDDFRDEIRAAQEGLIDGFSLLVMQITRNPQFVPDWRDLLSAK